MQCLILFLISDVSDNEDDSADEENNKNSTNIKGQKNIKDCYISLDKLKVEKGEDIKSKTKTQKVLNYKHFFFTHALTYLVYYSGFIKVQQIIH